LERERSAVGDLCLSHLRPTRDEVESIFIFYGGGRRFSNDKQHFMYSLVCGGLLRCSSSSQADPKCSLSPLLLCFAYICVHRMWYWLVSWLAWLSAIRFWATEIRRPLEGNMVVWSFPYSFVCGCSSSTHSHTSLTFNHAPFCPHSSAEAELYGRMMCPQAHQPPPIHRRGRREKNGERLFTADPLYRWEIGGWLKGVGGRTEWEASLSKEA
jgi:hypothetical protein